MVEEVVIVVEDARVKKAVNVIGVCDGLF